MNREQMLEQLDLHGADAASDFNDSEEVLGWFGWGVEGDILTVTFQPDAAGHVVDGHAQTWRLVPVEATTKPPETNHG
jgi:hypothetical protein